MCKSRYEFLSVDMVIEQKKSFAVFYNIQNATYLNFR